MKKVIALALAMIMTTGMSSIAFAANEYGVVFDEGEQRDNAVHYDSNGKLYKESSGKLKPATTEFKKGTTIYVPLEVKDNTLTNKDVLKYKVRTEWDVGGDTVTGASIAYKKRDNGTYGFFVAITSESAIETGTQELAGRLYVYKGNYKDAHTDQIAYIDMAKYGYSAVKFTENDTVYNDQAPYVYKFGDIEKDTENTITFDNVGEFEGNFYKQGKLYLGFNTKFNEDVGKLYPDAQLEFINFVGEPTFNKWGVMRLYADKEQYVYAIEDDKLVKVDATYDETFKGYRFGAKKLGTFILSDKVLDVSKYSASKDETETETGSESTSSEATVPAETITPVKPNPSTGR